MEGLWEKKEFISVATGEATEAEGMAVDSKDRVIFIILLRWRKASESWRLKSAWHSIVWGSQVIMAWTLQGRVTRDSYISWLFLGFVECYFLADVNKRLLSSIGESWFKGIQSTVKWKAQCTGEWGRLLVTFLGSKKERPDSKWGFSSFNLHVCAYLSVCEPCALWRPDGGARTTGIGIAVGCQLSLVQVLGTEPRPSTRASRALHCWVSLQPITHFLRWDSTFPKVPNLKQHHPLWNKCSNICAYWGGVALYFQTPTVMCKCVCVYSELIRLETTRSAVTSW